MPNVQNQVTQDETISENIKAKRVGLYGYDLAAGEWRRLSVNSRGQFTAEVGTTPVNGHKTIAVTNTAVAIVTSSTPVKNGVIIQALSGNGASVWVGSSSVTSSNGFELQAGQATSMAVSDLQTVYVNGTSGDGICYIASN